MHEHPRALVHGDGRRDVLQRGPAAVEHGDLVGARPPGAKPGDHVPELRVHLLACQQARGERVLQLADLRALVDDVDHERRARHQRGYDLLLALAVGADGGDERARRDDVAHDERAA